MKSKVLVVDDEVDICEFLKSNVESSGKYEVYTVNSANIKLICPGDVSVI